MKVQKSVVACFLFLLLGAGLAAAAPLAEPAPANAQTAAEADLRPADVFGASVLTGGDCAAAALRATDSESGDPVVNCGTCSSVACWNLNIGDYCGHGTSGPRFCLDAYESALCPAEDGIRCLCARELP